MLGRGEFAHLVLITKIKATEIICCFVPKEQIPKYPFSMHWKYFHALNCTEEVIKMSVSYLKRSGRTSRQQATETAAVLPWFPSFHFQGAAGAMSTHQRSQSIASSRSLQLPLWGGNGKAVGCATVPQEPQGNTEPPFCQGSRRRDPWHPVRRASQSDWPQKSEFPLKWVGALPGIYWIGQFPFQVSAFFGRSILSMSGKKQ